MKWSRVYLTLSINNIAYTVNGLRPVRNNRLLFGWSFFASWITIELAWFHLIWQVLATIVFGWLGGFRRAEGKVALGLSVASWAGLAVMIKQSIGARDEIRAALGDVVEQPVPRKRLPITITKHIEYHVADRGGKRLRMIGGRRSAGPKQAPLHLDVYHPTAPPEPGTRRPAIIEIHGGGWVIGDKREQGLPLLKLLASQGWVGFNVNYRLSPAVAFPEMLIDLKRAVVWIREHADEYGIDPEFIAVTGGSAGGHLCALMGLTGNDPEFQPGFEDADTSLQAAVPFYGVYDFTNRNGNWLPEVIDRFVAPMVMQLRFDEHPEAFHKASPMDQVGPDAPPFLVIHGDRDTLTPPEDAAEFVSRLQAVSAQPVHHLELHGAQHAFDIFPSIRCDAVIAAVDQFLTRCYENHQARVHESDALHLAEADTTTSPHAPPPPLESVLGRDR